AGRGQLDAELLRLRGEELVWNLYQNPRAVTGQRIATTRTAMRQVHQNLEPRAHDFVTLLPPNINDKPDATGIVFIRGVIKSLAGRWSLGIVLVHGGLPCLLRLDSRNATGSRTLFVCVVFVRGRCTVRLGRFGVPVHTVPVSVPGVRCFLL